MLLDREIRDAEEERDCDRAEDGERRRGIPAVRTPERIHPVGDRLDAGQGRRARGESAQQHEQGHGAGAVSDRVRNDRMRGLAEQALDETDTDEREHGSDEGVRRQRECKPRLADAAEVDEDDDSEAPEREQDLVGLERRRERRDRKDAGGDRDRNREHVVGEQRGSTEKTRKRPEVVLGDDVGPATGFVRLDGLAIRSDHDRE